MKCPGGEVAPGSGTFQALENAIQAICCMRIISDEMYLFPEIKVSEASAHCTCYSRAETGDPYARENLVKTVHLLKKIKRTMAQACIITAVYQTPNTRASCFDDSGMAFWQGFNGLV